MYKTMILICCITGGVIWAADRESTILTKMDTPDLSWADPNCLCSNSVHSPLSAPFAVSNSMMWLSCNGYPALAPQDRNKQRAQCRIANVLSGRNYMQVYSRLGTTVTAFLESVYAYVENTGYHCEILEHRGWRENKSQFKTRHEIPTLDFIIDNLECDCAVWVNIGWYQYDRSQNTYTRRGCHWMTVVGYGVNRKGKTASNYIILHDPSPAGGIEPRHEYAMIKVISGGRLAGKKTGLPRPAYGYLQIEDGIQLHPEADTAIIDGVVVMHIIKPLR